MPHQLTADQLLEIGDALSASLEGVKIGKHTVSNSFIPSNFVLGDAMQAFVKRTFEQALFDAGVQQIPTPEQLLHLASERKNASCTTDEGRLWSIVDSLGNMTALLAEARPCQHDMRNLRKDFISQLIRETDLGKHAAKETCGRFQEAVIEAVDSALGRTKM